MIRDTDTRYGKGALRMTDRKLAAQFFDAAIALLQRARDEEADAFEAAARSSPTR